MVVRPATMADLDAILAITNIEIRDGVAHLGTEPEPPGAVLALYAARRPEHPWLVADDDGVVVGFARVTPWKPRGGYRHSVESTVYLSPSHVGQGLGHALMDALLDALLETDVRTVMAGVSLPNDASAALHERLGYQQVARFPNIGHKRGRWIDVGYWALDLDTRRDGQAPA